ncbi:hypothetical protein ACM66B_000294 [Microbotryomycetes sp. NB124-2]
MPPTSDASSLQQTTVVYDYVDAQSSASLDCPICRAPFVQPVMSPQCQHVFCQQCIHRALSTTKSCPIDRTRLEPIELVRAPRIIEHLCDELQVYCSNKQLGCDAVLERSALDRHLRRNCSATRSSVANKGKAVDRAEGPGLDTSTRLDGQEAVLDSECEACGDLLAAEDEPTHSKVCLEALTVCTHCSAELKRRRLSEHHLECPLVLVPCPHARHGCTARAARSRMLDEHLDLTCPYEPIKDYLARQDSRLVELEGDNAILAARCASMESDMKEMRQLMLGLRNNMGEYFPALSLAKTQDQPAVTPSALPLPSPAPQVPVSPALSTHMSPMSPQADPFAFLPLAGTSIPAAATSARAPPSSLPATISSLQSTLSTLATTVTSLETRQSTNLLNETMRIQDDVQSLRAIVHGIRMQMHYLMMELGRLTGSAGGVGSSGPRPSTLGPDSAGIRRMSSSGSSSNESDLEDEHGNPHPSSRWSAAPGQNRFFGGGSSAMAAPMIGPLPVFQQSGQHGRMSYPAYHPTGLVGQGSGFNSLGGIKL